MMKKLMLASLLAGLCGTTAQAATLYFYNHTPKRASILVRHADGTKTRYSKSGSIYPLKIDVPLKGTKKVNSIRIVSAETITTADGKKRRLFRFGIWPQRLELLADYPGIKLLRDRDSGRYYLRNIHKYQLRM